MVLLASSSGGTRPWLAAFAVLGGTLVRLQVTQVADRDVLAPYDAADELEFKRG
jgi:hypothetical protein